MECNDYLRGSHTGLARTHRLEMCLKSERMGVQYTNPVLFSAGFCACAESRCPGTHPSRIPKDNVFKTPCRTMHWASMGKKKTKQPYSRCWQVSASSFWAPTVVYPFSSPRAEESRVYSVCRLLLTVITLSNGEGKIKLWFRKLKTGGLRAVSERSWTWESRHCLLGLEECAWEMRDTLSCLQCFGGGGWPGFVCSQAILGSSIHDAWPLFICSLFSLAQPPPQESQHSIVGYSGAQTPWLHHDLPPNNTDLRRETWPGSISNNYLNDR